MPTESTTYAAPGPAAEATDWKGTARYEVLRCIGKGGMGVVYEAFDRERQQRVALKTLLNSSPAGLYLFKQEFRTLSDVHHRNLVRLYELVATGADRIFFTMELVDGTDFLTYVQRVPTGEQDEPSAGVDAEPTRRERTRDFVGRPLEAKSRGERSARAVSEQTEAQPKTSPADFERLRPALRQLVDGVRALHGAGKLHRDIKPSNVRVTPEGRVVLLDFGVATDLSRIVDENQQESGEMVGTARYMAPEQALNEGPTPACDWYSVGVMLYEALVGSPPFMGSAFDVLKMKSMLDPPAPSECIEGVPPELDSLSIALLQRAPELRPTGVDILQQLGFHPSNHPPPLSIPVPEGPPTIVGRESQLRALRDAFEAARSGRSVTVLVSGPAGMGKSTIVQHFLDGLVERGEAAVLRGRAYERESVAYKGVDSVVDALSRYLMRLSDREDALTLPNEVAALARLFPVLRRVPSIASMEEQPAGDPQRMRRRAFVALRELVASLARRQPLVIFVDGAQWADVDSAALLLDLMRPPDAPPLLLVLTYRDEEVQTSPFLLEARSRWPAMAELRTLTVGPLDVEEARRLALALLGTDDSRAQLAADAIAVESRGSPFLVDELTRSVSGPHRVERSEDTSPGIAIVTLEQMVKARLALLPRRELKLLRVVAVAGRPLPVSVAADAAGIHDAVDDAVGLVRARRFVRTGIRGGSETVEMIHDRIREMIVAKLSPSAVREHHRQLARVLESSSDADPEAVAAHLIGAGERARSAQFAERAAVRATDKLAFDRAAALYRMAIESTPPATPDVQRLRLRLAEVLEWAGRGTESASVYLEAAEHASVSDRIELERAAAEQLLTSGRIDEGAVVLHRVLDSLGMKAPRSALRALLLLVVYRVWLLVVGLRFVERDPKDVRREDRVRIDTLYSLTLGFVLVDVVLGACMQARHLIFALRYGDRFQVMRALSLEASNLASAGGKERSRERALRGVSLRLARRGDPDEQTFVEGTHGIALFLHGRFKDARALLEKTANTVQLKRAGWQSNAFIFAVDTLLVLGDLHEAEALRSRLLVEAEQRGDLFTLVSLHTRATVLLSLAADDPTSARRHLREAMTLWSQSGFYVQHWQAMLYEAEIELYVSAGARAYARLEREERGLRKSLLLNVQVIRVLTAYLRARCAVASIVDEPEHRDARIAEARRLGGRLEREGIAWARLLGAMVMASVANATGDRRTAIALLRDAIALGEPEGMLLHVAAARLRLGLLLEGEAGVLMVEQAQDDLTARNVRMPERMAYRLLPGQWGDPPKVEEEADD